jgi:hypothetical protein
LKQLQINPQWTIWNIAAESLQNSYKATESALVQAQKAPAYLKQPLPPDSFYGKRLLFFLHTPLLIRHGWKASFQAQEMVFTKGTSMVPCAGKCEFHAFYRYLVPYRIAKNATTGSMPVALFIMQPPEDYGTMNVENIYDKNDGVWYQSGFNPFMSWSGHNNPFIAHRKDAVERFYCEHVADEFKWKASQHGIETPKDRGNLVYSMFYSMLYSKPVSMQREQFITLGNMRASLCIAPAFEFA